MIKLFYKISFSLSLLTVIGFLVPSEAAGQTEKLGIVRYTAPKGMSKLPKENVIVFSEYNATTSTYCIITLYGATPGTGTPQGDFKREWNNLVLKQMKADEAAPKTDSQKQGEWTAVSGGSIVETDVGKAVSYLTVISSGGTAVSVLAIFNDPAYATQADAFIGSLAMDKAAPKVNNAASGAASGTAAFDAEGNLIIPQPLRDLTTADLAGVWIDGPNRMTTEYVYSGSGKSAGRDTTAYEVKTTFKSDGTYSSFFNSVRNKQSESDTKTGPYSINGRLLSIQGTGYSGKTIVNTKYVIRGWLELPSMTVLQLAGPWYDDAPIPEVNFTDFGPDSKYRGVTRWIRVK